MLQQLLHWKISGYYTTWVCIFVALGIQHATRIRHVVICGLPRFTVFFHITSYTAAVAQWLRCYATNRKVAGSIPAVVCIVSASIASHAGKQTNWHPNRASSAKNCGRSIRRRLNDICDVPDRLQDNIRSHPDL